MPTKVEISHKTVVFTAIFIAAIWGLIQIREILFYLFIAFIFMSALRPMVDWLEKRKIPRSVATIFIYIVVLGLIGVSVMTTIPSIILQIQHLVEAFPSFISRIMPYWNIDFNAMSQQAAPLGENVVKLTVSIFSNVIAVVTVLMLTFYFVLERKHTDTFIASLMGEAEAKRVSTVLYKVEQRLGSWVLGQVFLMLIIGISSYIGLSFLRIEYALPLAVLAGLLEIVPNIGPILSSIPAIIIGLSISPLLGLSVMILYFVIHQAENTVIVPFVMKKSVGLPPLITILSLMIGAKLAGIGGAVLAVPLVLVIQEIVGELSSSRTGKDKK